MKKTIAVLILLLVTLGSAAMVAESLDTCDDCCETDHCNGAACCRAGALSSSMLSASTVLIIHESPEQSYSPHIISITPILLTADLDRPPRA